MATFFLLIIYLAFISLGLPDSILGSAWPVMRPEFDALLETELARDCWVMDGNFCRTLARRLEFADTVIFLRTSRLICLTGVLRRWIRYHGRSRPDLAAGCPEKIDPAFLRYIWNYEKVTRPRVEELLASRPERCRLIRLNSRREAEHFLRTL